MSAPGVVHPQTGGGSSPTALKLNVRYLLSIPGIFKTVEIVLAFVVCFLAGVTAKCKITATELHEEFSCSDSGIDLSSIFKGEKFVLFVASVTLIISVVLLVVHLLSINEISLNAGTWTFIVIGYNAAAALLWLIAWCVQAKYAHDAGDYKLPGNDYHLKFSFYGQYIAATIFGVFAMVVYIADTLLLFMKSRDGSMLPQT